MTTPTAQSMKSRFYGSCGMKSTGGRPGIHVWSEVWNPRQNMLNLTHFGICFQSAHGTPSERRALALLSKNVNKVRAKTYNATAPTILTLTSVFLVAQEYGPLVRSESRAILCGLTLSVATRLRQCRGTKVLCLRWAPL